MTFFHEFFAPLLARALPRPKVRENFLKFPLVYVEMEDLILVANTDKASGVDGLNVYSPFFVGFKSGKLLNLSQHHINYSYTKEM